MAGTEHDDDRRETRLERYDRNWVELLQELRVMQTGVQVLFGFLLVVPFQTRFNDLQPWDRGLYLVVFACVAASTICNVAPAAAHRLVFQKNLKPALVRSSAAWAKRGLVFLGLALVGAAALVVDLVLGPIAALVAGTVTLVAIVAVWLIVPLRLMRPGPTDGAPPASDVSP